MFLLKKMTKILIYTLAGFLARLRFYFSKKENKLFRNNLRHVLKMSEKSVFSKLFMQQVYHNQILVTLEVCLEILCPGSIRLEGEEELKKIMSEQDAKRQGKVMISGHLGAWDLIGYFVSKHTTKTFFALAKPSKYKIVTRLLNIIRKRLGISLIWTGRSVTQKEMAKVIEHDNWLGFVMDQKPRGRKGPKVHFWGIDTEFVTGPAQMAIKYNTPIVSIFCVRTGFLKYRMMTELLLAGEHGKKNMGEITQQMASKIEEITRHYPEQWCWSYKRWKFDVRMGEDGL